MDLILIHPGLLTLDKKVLFDELLGISHKFEGFNNEESTYWLKIRSSDFISNL